MALDKEKQFQEENATLKDRLAVAEQQLVGFAHAAELANLANLARIKRESDLKTTELEKRAHMEEKCAETFNAVKMNSSASQLEIETTSNGSLNKAETCDMHCMPLHINQLSYPIYDSR